MAGAIKGITVEIGGDTTKLGKALTDVNKQSKNLQNELKGVNSLLKMDPTNVTLLKQKQDLLTESIAATKTKLGTLKEAQAQVQEQFDKGEITEEQYRDFQREIVNTENKLKDLEGQARSFGSVMGQQLQAVGDKVKDVGAGVENLGDKFLGVSTVAAAVLGGSTKLASDFEDGVAKVGTVADTSQVSLEQLSDDMLALSTQTGKSATEISDATYQAISASVDTSDAVAFVGTATELAKAGFLETADAVDVLTTVINAYGLDADQAATISNMLVQTQNDGKTTVDELSQSIGKVIPLASAYGVNVDNLCTSYAELTKNGIATAEAGTYLKSMLSELGDSGSTVSTILKEQTGMSFAELMASGKSLGDVLDILSQSVNGNSTDFANLWSSTEAGTGALSLVGSGVDEFNNELGKMGDSATNVSDALETLDTPSNKATKALNALKNTGIILGETVLEALTPVLDSLVTMLQNLTTRFDNLDPSVKTTIATVIAVVAAVAPVLIVIGKVISGVGTLISVIGTIVSFVTGTLIPVITTIVSVIGWPITIIMAVIGVVVLLYNKCKWFRDGVNAVLNAIWTFIQTVVGAVVSFVQNFVSTVVSLATSIWTTIQTVFSTVVTWVSDNIITPVVTAVSSFFNSIKTFATNAWNGIKSVFSAVGSFFSGVFTTAYNGICNIFNKIATFFSGIWNKISTTFSALGTKIGDAIGGAVKSGINGILSAIEGIINGAIGLINGAIGLINLIPGVEIGKIGELHIPRLAKGGVLERGQVGLLEGDGAEAVVPLEQNTEWINRIADKLNGATGGNALIERIDQLENTIKNLKQSIVLDTGVFVGATVNQYDEALATNQLMKARGI